MGTESFYMETAGEEGSSREIETAETEKLQFRLSTLFWITTAVAIFCSIIFGMPDVVAAPLLVLIAMVLPAAITMGIIHGQARGRAFCIGAIFPSIFYMLSTWIITVVGSFDGVVDSIQDLIDITEEIANPLKLFLCVTCVLCLLTGILTVVIHWLLQRKKRIT